MGKSGRTEAGGLARAQKLSADKRTEIARKAAAARWQNVGEAVAGSVDSPLRIGDIAIECYVLDDGTRVLSQGSFLKALGRHRTVRRTGDDGVSPLIQGKALSPFVSESLLERAKPIPFTTPKGSRAHGYSAELLPDVCEVFLAARQANVLPTNQWHIADRAEILVRGLARVGIIALVDEATGYQEQRTRNALAAILAAYIDEQLQDYLPTFPPDFYREMYRLRGLDYSSDSTKRPQYFGKLTNDIVYSRLAPGVLDELKKHQQKTPAGNAKHKLFQHLTQNKGYPKLREHIGSVVTLMKLSGDWDTFKQNIDRIHPRFEKGQDPLW